VAWRRQQGKKRTASSTTARARAPQKERGRERKWVDLSEIAFGLAIPSNVANEIET